MYGELARLAAVAKREKAEKLAAVNKERAEKGLPPLAEETMLGGLMKGFQSLTSNAGSASAGRTSVVSSAAAGPEPSDAMVADWNKKWGRLVPGGKKVVYTSPIDKTNSYGMVQRRQLILSDGPSIFYADPATMQLRGEVMWPLNQPPRASVVS